MELLVQRSGYEFIEDDEVVAETITTVARGELDYEVSRSGFVNAWCGPVGISRPLIAFE